MAIVHMTLQGKGGVGKSYVASVLAQYLKRVGKIPICFDTDPINQTFSKFKALSVTHIKLSDGKDDEINPRKFDDLMGHIMSAPDDAVFVIDNGSSSYLPIISYMVENEIISVLKENGHEILFHAVVTGGQSYDDTVEGLTRLFRYFGNCQVVVWLNEFFGPVEKDEVPFLSSSVSQTNGKFIKSVVMLSQYRRETYGVDMELMLKNALTFEEALNTPDLFPIMSRQRLKIVSTTVFDALDRAQL